MNVKQRTLKAKKMNQKRLELRNQLWPEIEQIPLWDRNKEVGFVTLPRTLQLMMIIMDEMSNGKPVSKTFFALWCHIFDESFITIESPFNFAFESGFTGQRALNMWRERMKILSEMGFIKSKPGASGEFHYILVLDPNVTIKKHKEDNTQFGKFINDQTYNAFIERSINIGKSF